MNRRRRILLILGLLIVTALLAFILRSIVYEVVILPVAFMGFQLSIWYRSLAQGIWWWLIVVLVLFMLAFSLIPPEKPAGPGRTKAKPKHGQVENLARELERSKSGQYFKWIIANRLGKLAYRILLHREIGRPRTVFEPLAGEGWHLSPELQSYLEVGLRGSFADYPNPPTPFSTPRQTPLDHNVTEAIQFLESQVDNGHGSGTH